MVEINLWSGLRRFADGQDKVEVQGSTVGEILDSLVATHPGLAPVVQAGVSFSVDGQLIATSRSELVKQDSEIFLLQRLKGG